MLASLQNGESFGELESVVDSSSLAKLSVNITFNILPARVFNVKKMLRMFPGQCAYDKEKVIFGRK